MSPDDSPLRWTGWAIGKISLGIFVIVVAAFAWGVRYASEPYGAMAAMYAICAASMLFITSLPTQKDAKMDKIIDIGLRVVSMGLAFFSGGFWLRSELGDLTGPYLTILLLVAGTLTVASVIWLLLSTVLLNRLWNKLRNRSRHTEIEDVDGP